MQLQRFVLAAILTTNVFATPYAMQQDFSIDPRSLSDLRPRGGYLGVGIVDIDADRVSRLKLPGERGVEITVVEEGSPADTAGLKMGDVLLTYNGENILGGQQFVRLVRETPASRKVRLSVWRNGKEQSVVVTMSSLRPSLRPVFPGSNSDDFPSLGSSDVRPIATPDIPKIIMGWDNASIGIECEPVGRQLAEFFGVREGILVRSVGKGTAAEKAGFKAGDVLTAAGDRPIRTPDDFRRVLHSGLKQVAVSVMRSHKALTLSVMPLPERDE